MPTLLKNYNAKPGKSYLIYGYDFYHNCEITNMLIKHLLPNYNEMLYFDLTSYSNCIDFKIPQEEVELSINIFEYFNYTYSSKIDIQLQHNHVAKFILNYISQSPKNDQLNIIKNLLEDIFTLKPIAFSFKYFIQILNEIIEKSEDKTYKDFFILLASIEKIKKEDPDDFTLNVNFKELAKKARLQLENFLFSNIEETPALLINYKNYIFNKEIIKLFKKLRDTFQSMGTEINRYSSSVIIHKNKINHFRQGLSNLGINVQLKLYLELLVYKRKNSISYNKPLIFIQGIQKELFISDFVSIEEIFKSADLCFIVSSSKQLDKNVTSHIDVKFYDDNIKELSSKNKHLSTVRLEDNTEYFVSLS